VKRERREWVDKIVDRRPRWAELRGVGLEGTR